MGMYDELRCHYPLPVEGANARDYQTKDTPCQYLNHYEITTDGVLRHKEWGVAQGGDQQHRRRVRPPRRATVPRTPPATSSGSRRRSAARPSGRSPA